MKTTNLFAFLLAMLVYTAAARAITIDMVPVGNPGNVPDTAIMNDGTKGYGSVGYVYQIGKYEVTAGQYTEFLNAVAKSDPNGLYNTKMSNPNVWQSANIQRTGSAPNYIYSVAADWSNRPVNYVSFWDAARFANWLQNGQPTGPQGPGTTEDGAYINIGNQTTFARQAGARFFIPTENEWYKAAYHKNDGATGNYWAFATSSSAAPINTLPDPGNHANFWDDYGTGNSRDTIGPPYSRTPVGAFVNSASPYGTFDQSGNVSEWNETVRNTTMRGIRGGDFNSIMDGLYVSARGNLEPTSEIGEVGFRVASAASVPEPATIFLAVSGLVALLLRRRGRS